MHTFACCSLATTMATTMFAAAIAGSISTSETAHAGDPPQPQDDPRLIICFEDKPGDDPSNKAGNEARDEDAPGTAPKAIAEGNTAFAIDLFRELTQAQENVFFSPLSISTALSMTFAGARTETGEEMANVLHLPHEPQQRAARLSPVNRSVHHAFGALLRDLREPAPRDDDDENGEPGYEILLANALWGDERETFSDDYISLVDEHYNAPLTRLDFFQPESAAETINDWTKENTRGLIPRLVEPSDVMGASLVLTNAIYFLGDWASEFDPDKTRDRDFHTKPDATVTVPMMHQKAHFGYVEYDDAQAVILPYAGDRLSLVALLPNEGYETAGLMAHLTKDEIKRWTSAATKEVELAMPKFKMKTSSRLVGDAILPNLGMRRAISAQADFSGIDGGADGRALYISEVIHEAVIEIDERGTEAAAATAVIAIRASVQPTPSVTLDRPFVFLIIDHETESILFMGRVVDPTG